MLRLLSNSRYRQFFLSFTAGNFAEGLVIVSVPFVILVKTGDPFVVGLSLACQTAGVLALAFPGASIADRYPRQKVISAAYLAAAIALIGMFISLQSGLGIWGLAGCLFLFGGSTAVYGPASDAMTPRLVFEEDLHRANSMDGLSQRIGQGILGPLVGGGLVASGLGVWTFLVSAILCFAGASIILKVRLLDRSRTESELEDEGGRSWPSVLRYLRTTPLFVALLAWVSLVIMLQVGSRPVAGTTWAAELPGGGAALYGMTLSIGAVSSALIVIAVGSLPMPRKYIEVMVAAWSIGAGVVAVAVVAPYPWGFVVAYATASCFMAVGNIYWSTYLQRTVPDEYLARVISIDWVASLSLTPLGAVLAGAVVGLWGPGIALIGVAVIPFTTGALMLMFVNRYSKRLTSETPLTDAETSDATKQAG
jgi:MFS family permease